MLCKGQLVCIGIILSVIIIIYTVLSLNSINSGDKYNYTRSSDLTPEQSQRQRDKDWSRYKERESLSNSMYDAQQIIKNQR